MVMKDKLKKDKALFEGKQHLSEAKMKMTDAAKTKVEMSKDHEILTWWQLEDKLKKEGLITKDQALAFFCPVYYAGQLIVKQLLDKYDEHGELILFPLPAIQNPSRIEIGLEYMRKLGIKKPEQHLKNGKLPTFSMLPGIEGVGMEMNRPEFVAYEAVQLGAFQIVPKRWLNAGDPYNDSYRIPGESGYSPYWRIPSPDDFERMRPDLFKGFKKTKDGMIKTNFNGM